MCILTRKVFLYHHTLTALEPMQPAQTTAEFYDAEANALAESLQRMVVRATNAVGRTADEASQVHAVLAVASNRLLSDARRELKLVEKGLDSESDMFDDTSKQLDAMSRQLPLFDLYARMDAGDPALAKTPALADALRRHRAQLESQQRQPNPNLDTMLFGLTSMDAPTARAFAAPFLSELHEMEPEIESAVELEVGDTAVQHATFEHVKGLRFNLVLRARMLVYATDVRVYVYSEDPDTNDESVFVMPVSVAAHGYNTFVIELLPESVPVNWAIIRVLAFGKPVASHGYNFCDIRPPHMVSLEDNVHFETADQILMDGFSDQILTSKRMGNIVRQLDTHGTSSRVTSQMQLDSPNVIEYVQLLSDLETKQMFDTDESLKAYFYVERKAGVCMGTLTHSEEFTIGVMPCEWQSAVFKYENQAWAALYVHNGKLQVRICKLRTPGSSTYTVYSTFPPVVHDLRIYSLNAETPSVDFSYVFENRIYAGHFKAGQPEAGRLAETLLYTPSSTRDEIINVFVTLTGFIVYGIFYVKHHDGFAASYSELRRFDFSNNCLRRTRAIGRDAAYDNDGSVFKAAYHDDTVVILQTVPRPDAASDADSGSAVGTDSDVDADPDYPVYDAYDAGPVAAEDDAAYPDAADDAAADDAEDDAEAESDDDDTMQEDMVFVFQV